MSGIDVNDATVKEKVKRFLMNTPASRDNDHLLIWLVWQSELNGRTFREAFISNSLTSVETVTRVRRKWQQIRPALRGYKYGARHEHVPVVQGQVRMFDDPI